MKRANIEYLRKHLPGSLFFFLAGLYRLPRQLLTIDLIRFLICYARKIYYLNILKRARTFENTDKGVGDNTIMHNLKGLKDMSVHRSHLIIRPVTSIDKIIKSKETCNVLTIGPRTEGEIFNLIGYGFNSKNIHALDLISYSPYVTLGDMHNIPYEDNFFDIIFSGWVLSYSNNRKKAAEEILRVAKKGAIIALGASYDPKTDAELENENGYLTGAKDRFNNINELLHPFQQKIKHTYFCQDVEDPKTFCDMVGIFSVK